MEFGKRNIIGIGAGIFFILLSVIFFRNERIFYFVIVSGAIISILPFIISLAFDSSKQKEVEEKFLEFIRDIVENVRTGTPISKAIVNLKTRDYGKLSNHVQKLSNQISLGIPLSEAMITFSKDTKSSVISRAIALISEAEKAGGQIDTILESVAGSVHQTDVLKKERRSAVFNLVVQGYIIFMVFIIIMIILQFKILPLVYELANVNSLSLNSAPSAGQKVSSAPLLVLILVQSFFTGLVIGKISEGSIKDGIKHSFILLALTLLITTGANAFLG